MSEQKRDRERWKGRRVKTNTENEKQQKIEDEYFRATRECQQSKIQK